ncbi:Membrane protein TerC, possibly involved in tellurium resistance [Candidatus Nitrosarchaeum limnium SFB1]|uniref:Membrane protein TerC, possibly involved in tellurium resistance n=1 Tax=Candidatus Nitrosarchaeum limnium SFB1 TaxID=886738 RepID=F3KIG2_9ARCH|nr:Membrane protein TerC, possibly involved in tellurium resistance [Candidatus Nitrosarchaeum limnium SFB1]
MPIESGVITLELWILFFTILGITIAIDLGLIHKLKRKLRKSSQPEIEHIMSSKEALGWTLTWISLAGVFAGVIYFALGNEKMIEFVTGYALEKSLSVDNMFVFLLVFTTLGIPHKYQHRVLSLGILSAIAMRIALILVGASLLENFHWMIYVFGGLLWFTSIRMIMQKEEKKIELEKNIAVRILKKFMPVNLSLVGNNFIIRINGVLHATPLLVGLAIIELTDLVFAMDSIPAVLAITRDPFIVITSNVFAILGLRALYFLIGGMLERFHYLKPGLIVLLLFIGTKMIISEFYHIPTVTSLVIVFVILSTVIVASLLKKPKTKQ